MADTNRQWLLRSRPVGMVEASDFELRTTSIPTIGEGQILVRTLWLSLEPAMRGWITDKPNYMPPVELGAVMRGMGVGEVVESRLDGYAEGDLVSGMTGWQEWVVGDGGFRKLAEGVDPPLSLSILGITGMTAYFGLLDIGQPKPGDVVVVSAAAGATGSVVGQIAKIKGCRVVGIAGGSEKCRWLREKAGFDATIDYKNEDVGKRLDALCPDGIDVYFDNVGGEILDAALGRIARGARVVICGSISTYNLEEPAPGPSNYYRVVAQRARIEGFVILDYFPRFEEATREIVGWAEEGKLVWEVDVARGFENLPETLRRLYDGSNFGKQLLEINTSAAAGERA